VKRKLTISQAIAQDFLGFFKNFQDTFGIKNFKIYVTGESYAGRYVPYISAAMLDAENTQYFNLSGESDYACIVFSAYLSRCDGI
jgi:carboxypeptidase D